MKYLYALVLFITLFSKCQQNNHKFTNATELIGKKNPMTSYLLKDKSPEKDFGTLEIINADHPEFDSALVITCNKITIMDWDLLVTTKVKDTVSKGDIIYLEFYGKTLYPKSGSDIGQVTFKYNSLILPVILDTGWKKYSTYAVVDSKIDPSDLWIHCSFEPQTIALGGIQMLRFEPGHDLSFFNDCTPLYKTSGKWEKDADRRIDSLRKANAKIILKDDNGNPLAGVDYKIEMTKHLFRFGTAIDPNLVTGSDENSEKYRTIIKQDFNHIVYENHLKWQPWDNPESKKLVFESLKWLDENDISARGHALVWPWFDFPLKLIQLNHDTVALKKAIVEHITEEASLLKGRLMEWDVLNEPFVVRNLPHNDEKGLWLYQNIRNVLGEEEILKWYRTVHSIDPDVRMFINDYDIVADGANAETHKKDFKDFITMLIRNGIPLGGIGFQGHFEGYLTSPEHIYEVINQFAEFGLPIVITEFDVDISDGHDEELYNFTHDFMKTCFSHPSIDGIINWGFWAGRHWKPKAAFYDINWNRRANGKAWRDAVYGEWWTIEEGKTGNSGEISFKGFLGDYRLSFMQNGINMEKTFSLGRNGVKWNN